MDHGAFDTQRRGQNRGLLQTPMSLRFVTKLAVAFSKIEGHFRG